MSLATFKTKLKTYLFRRSQWLSKTTWRCCGVFAISAPRYKWLYLLTYKISASDAAAADYDDNDDVYLLLAG